MSATHVDLMRHEIVELLVRHDVGRLCILDGGYPIAVPVNYRLDQDEGTDRVVIQTAESTAIARAAGPASLEVDHIDLETGAAWSVIARGQLHRLFDDYGLPSTNPIITAGRDQWLTLEVTALSGRRFHVTPRPSTLDQPFRGGAPPA